MAKAISLLFDAELTTRVDLQGTLVSPVAHVEQSFTALIEANRYAGVLSPALVNCRFNELMPSPWNAEFKLAVIEFNVPGAKNGGTDKGPNGHRIDSIPIANGVIKAGGACEIKKYYYD